ncbi:hypothetical protein D3C72_1543660 [compost metagenome]
MMNNSRLPLFVSSSNSRAGWLSEATCNETSLGVSPAVRASTPRASSVLKSVMDAGTWLPRKVIRSIRWASTPLLLMVVEPMSPGVKRCLAPCRKPVNRWRSSMVKVTTTTVTDRPVVAVSTKAAGSISMPPTLSVATASPAPRQRLPTPALRRCARRRPWTSSAGRGIPLTACRPGASTLWATGANRTWARPTACLTPCRCRSSVITPASAPGWTGGGACRTRSTRVLPWPPSAPWPSRRVITATTLG